MNNTSTSDQLLFSPGIQMQVNSPRPSMQVPRFWQGFESHSFTFISHLGPVYPYKETFSIIAHEILLS